MPDSAKWRKTIAVSSSNSVGAPSRRETRSAAGSTSATRRVNVAGVDRPAVDLDPLAIRDEVRLGRLADAKPGCPQRAAGQREDAALPVRAPDERAPHAELRIAEGAEKGTRPSEAETDAEPSTLGEGLEGVLVLERLASVGGGVVRTHAASRHSRLSSSS